MSGLTNFAPGRVGPSSEMPEDEFHMQNPAAEDVAGRCVPPRLQVTDGAGNLVAAGRVSRHASARPGQLNYVFVRAARSKTLPDDALFLVPAGQGQRASRRKLQAVASDRQVHVKNVVARYPGGPIWPLQMRADMVAAYLDFVDTKDLCAAITGGEAPPPTTTRTKGKTVELIWHKEFVDRFISAKVSEAGSNLRRVHRGEAKPD
jgi:hypothetical protein